MISKIVNVLVIISIIVILGFIGYITLVKKSRQNQPLSSDYIAEKLNLSRGTVVHHLTRLMGSGIVLREKEGYLIRENSLQDLVKDLQRDIEGIFLELKEVALEIDQKLG